MTIERANRTRNAFYNETEVEKANKRWSTRDCIDTCVEKNRFKNKQSKVRRIRESLCGLHRSSTEKSVPWLWITCYTVMCGDESSCREVKRVRNVADEDVRGLSNARLCTRRCIGRKSKSIRIGSPHDYATIWKLGLAFPESPKTVNEMDE